MKRFVVLMLAVINMTLVHGKNFLKLGKSVVAYKLLHNEGSMIQVGKKAPDFTAEAMVDGQIKTVSLHDFNDTYKVIFFYPLDFTFVCPTELHAFQELQEEFAKRNVSVIGVSVDSVHSHHAWLNTPKAKGGIQGVTYPLVSDIHKTISRDYGVLDAELGIALRGVFIIDKDNVVQSATINNLSLGRNIPEVLRVIDALQHVEKHGDVCPANWTDGKETMVPTQEGLNVYFAARSIKSEQSLT